MTDHHCYDVLKYFHPLKNLTWYVLCYYSHFTGYYCQMEKCPFQTPTARKRWNYYLKENSFTDYIKCSWNNVKWNNMQFFQIFGF